MPGETCASCRRPKADLNCELCQDFVCKDCVQVLPEDGFLLRPKLSEELTHLRYCQACFDSKVAPELDAYQETVARAKQVFFFFESQRARLPILAKARLPYKVTDQADRDETIMRIAYQAAADGFNAVIEAVVTAEKTRNHGYQKSRWTGQGIGAKVDAVKLERDFE